jgi:hypothetical protein
VNHAGSWFQTCMLRHAFVQQVTPSSCAATHETRVRLTVMIGMRQTYVSSPRVEVLYELIGVMVR